MDFATLADNAQQQALDLAAAYRQAHANRCGITKSDCAGTHVHACETPFTKATICQGSTSEICAASGCGYNRDPSITSVRLPKNLLQTATMSNAAIEAVCYSGLLEPLMKDIYNAPGADIKSAYAASVEGPFLYYPAEAQKTCGDYDPRLRPWYVAASSGPKDIIIVIDQSGSMLEAGRWELAKAAVKVVVQGLNNNDFVGIVAFSSGATVLGQRTALLRASEEAKAVLLQELDELVPNGATNFGSAFTKAFDLFDTSAANDATTLCAKTVLMLTDGAITEGATASEVIDAVKEKNVNHNATIFTYSLGSGADRATTQTIACDTDGMYQHIADGGDLIGSMGTYFQYYAIGMGSGPSADRTVWVEPYKFASSGEIGTTVSCPVYDGNGKLVGVVAVDFTLSTFTKYTSSAEVLRDLIDRSKFCPSFTLSECDRQAFRASISAESVCPAQCNTFQKSNMAPPACMADEEYPQRDALWRPDPPGVNYGSLSYVERACCGQKTKSKASVVYSATQPSCTADTKSAAYSNRLIGGTATPFPIVLVALLVLLLLR